LIRIRSLIHNHIPPAANKSNQEWEKRLFGQRGGDCDANIHKLNQGRQDQRYPKLFKDYLRCHQSPVDSCAELKPHLAAEEWATTTIWVLADTDRLFG